MHGCENTVHGKADATKPGDGVPCRLICKKLHTPFHLTAYSLVRLPQRLGSHRAMRLGLPENLMLVLLRKSALPARLRSDTTEITSPWQGPPLAVLLPDYRPAVDPPRLTLAAAIPRRGRPRQSLPPQRQPWSGTSLPAERRTRKSRLEHPSRQFRASLALCIQAQTRPASHQQSDVDRRDCGDLGSDKAETQRGNRQDHQPGRRQAASGPSRCSVSHITMPWILTSPTLCDCTIA